MGITGMTLASIFLALSAREHLGKKVVIGSLMSMDYQYLTEVEFVEELDKVIS